MYLRLSSINLRAKPSRTILTLSAIIISVTFFTFFNSFEAGLRSFLLSSSIEQNPLTQITVKPKSGSFGQTPLSLLTSSQSIDPQTVDQIKKIPHVIGVEPQSTIKGISSLQISLMGQTFQTDALIFGSPYQTIAASNIKEDQWKAPPTFDENHPVPALVSSRLIDLYNYSFATANNLPKISPEMLTGIDVEILLNQSTFFGGIGSQETPRIKAKIMGFSSKIKLIGITIPEDAVDQINQQFLKQQGKNYTDLIVKVDSVGNLSAVKNALKELKLDANSGQDELELINQYFFVLSVGLTLISLIVFLVCGLMIASTFLTKVAERTKDIGIMRAIGASSRQIANLFLTEAGIIGLISGLIGYVCAFFLSLLANFVLSKILADFQYKPDSFFVFSPLQFLIIMIATILFCLIFAYLPAQQAARLDPLKALSK